MPVQVSLATAKVNRRVYPRMTPDSRAYRPSSSVLFPHSSILFSPRARLDALNTRASDVASEIRKSLKNG